MLTRPGGVLRWVIVATCALILCAIPAKAAAAHGLVTGFVDAEDLYASADPGVRATWLNRAVESDAGIVRLHVSWAAMAGANPPSDPTNPRSASYDFSATDRAVRDAQTRGLGVILTINGAPSWAEGPGRPSSAGAGTWRPNPTALADFARAVAARYSGGLDPDGIGPASPLPAVRALQVWNEANLSDHLTPQYEGTIAVSPGLYREMLNESYAAVKAVAPRMLVVTAGTGPYGDPRGGERIKPVAFWKQTLCASPTKKMRKKHKKKRKRKKRDSKTRAVKSATCDGPVKFDVLAHHPINTSGRPRQSALDPEDASSANLERIVRVLRGAERAHTVLPGRHPVWATEIWWDSNPPNRAGFRVGAHARALEDALYQAWKDGASVAINLAIRDLANTPPSGVKDGSGSGIFFADGRKKPAYTAFRFPFVTERKRGRTLSAWGKAPATGKLVIQRRRGERWIAVKKVRVRSGAVFLARLHLAGKQRLRAVVAGNRSLVWKQG